MRRGVVVQTLASTLAVASMSLLLSLASACDRAGHAADERPVDGAQLFQRTCAACHGALGAGDGPAAGLNYPSDLRSAEFHTRTTDAEMRDVIRNGRGLMPPWRHLSDRQLDALVAFVRTLREDAPAPIEGGLEEGGGPPEEEAE